MPVTRGTRTSSCTTPLCCRTRGKRAREIIPETKEHTIWSLNDESWLIQHISTHRTKGGEGLNFDKTFWAATSAAMAADQSMQGCVKTSEACQSKWSQIHRTFNVVDRLANYSRIDFSLEHSANITEASESVWTDLVKSIPQAKQYKNKGWPHYDTLKDILPSKERGDIVHHATMWPAAANSERALNTTEHANPNIPLVPDTPISPIIFDPARQPPLFAGTNILESSTTSMSSTPTTSRALGKHRAANGDDSPRIIGRPPDCMKTGRHSGISFPEVFDHMSTKIHGLRSAFNSATSAMQECTPHMQEHMTHVVAHSVDPIPQEEGLTDSEMVVAMTHIQSDVVIADTYLSIQKDELWKLFLSQYFN
ncbi:uncharacterized protein F5891DRAFT_1180214 [Suillus fuscotomentosus]|uniref:Myb/SANT-like domain-containing protein n=1 Tax=Suillus fuscotomentosus TaxID=1912939 RepID=A0AAD4EQA4_9AGAM|nr:uncharacterized protein F5891DRAFT_1180214 [Suillus fuscotomentosus]KAG1908674.1 hypothetical protein F5891DRAFT_1180214 [Suillus fuscotomentosus]